MIAPERTGSADFPTDGAFQNFFGGSFDAFIAKIDTNASGAASLVFCSYLGGIGDDKAYGIAIDSGMIVNLIGAVFILPFMLFSATSGQLADKYDKAAVMRVIKWFEIVIMVVLGVLIGGMVIAMYLPIFKLAATI